MPTNPPSVPSLDVEACVRLLEECAAAFALAALNSAPESPQQLAHNERALGLSALASALPGMGKDSADLNWLERESAKRALTLGWLDDTRAERAIYEDASYLVPDHDGVRIVAQGEPGAGLRSALSAARAADAEETKPNE